MAKTLVELIAYLETHREEMPNIEVKIELPNGEKVSIDCIDFTQDGNGIKHIDILLTQ